MTWSAQEGAVELALERAEGQTLFLQGGHAVLDLVSTSFHTNFGHSFAPILEALRQQLGGVCTSIAKASTPQRSAAARGLVDAVGHPGRILFTLGGAESVENALKLARSLTGRARVLSRCKSYHGATLGALGVTGDWRRNGQVLPEGFGGFFPDPASDPEGDGLAACVAAHGPDRIAALCIETVSGANGVHGAPVGWWRRARSLCDATGALLILDEVLCGFGRTGPCFAFQDAALAAAIVEPDFVCMAKALTGGYAPLGALWVSERHARHYDAEVLSAGLTHYAHPLGLAAAEVVLDVLAQPAFQSEKRALEACFSTLVGGLATHPAVAGVRHAGLLAALDLRVPAPPWEHFIEAGIHLVVKPDMLILAPAFTTTQAELARGVSLLSILLDAQMASAEAPWPGTLEAVTAEAGTP